MDNHWGRSGAFGLVFAALVLVFNWPLLSIPGPGRLLGWLLAAWIAGIALLALAARRVLASRLPLRDAESKAPPAAVPSAEPTAEPSDGPPDGPSAGPTGSPPHRTGDV